MFYRAWVFWGLFSIAYAQIEPATTALPWDNCSAPRLTSATRSTYAYIVQVPQNWSWTGSGWASQVFSDNSSTFGIEGVEAYANGCYVCRYSYSPNADPYWARISPGGSIGASLYLGDDEHASMFGPCFDARPSKPMVCMQHPALYPQDILGEYYYPVQRMYAQPYGIDDADAIRNSAIHLFLNKGSQSTTYGIGKQAVIDDLRSFLIKNKTTNEVDREATSLFLKDFQGENWPKWAQVHCSPGCHRDAMYTQRIFVGDDPIYSDARYWATQRFQTPEGKSAETLVPSCRKCPRGTAVYARTASYFGGNPYNIYSGPFVMVCRPWFGTLPVLEQVSDGLRMKGSNVAFRDNEYIRYPSSGLLQFEMVTCPVNTFNRICADDWYLRYSTSEDEPTCATCSSIGQGWHTGGATGAWFCLPPAGMVFTQRRYLTANTNDAPYWANGTQWRRRDLWRYELECGGAGQCQQCEVMNIDMTPAEFNEEYIFRPFLATAECARNSYCPDSMTQISCPESRPVSPPGSTSITNCTCRAGTWWNGDSCQQCTSLCSNGQYAPLSRCLKVDGAVADAPCDSCTNIDSNTMDSISTGYEVSPGVGLCGFTCRIGYTLSPSGSCQPMTPVKSSLAPNITYFNSNVRNIHDSYRIDANGNIQKILALTRLIEEATLALSKGYNASGWMKNIASCPKTFTNVPQYLSDYVGYEAVYCKPCNITTPTGGYLAPLTSYTLAGCLKSPSCPATTYLNRTSWSCASCVARQTAVCPNGTFLHGEGCLGVSTPFNVTNPHTDCRGCSIDVASVPPGQYLLTTLDGGCRLQNCVSVPTGSYPDVPCGGANPGVSKVCPAGCPAGFWNTQSDVGCTTSHFFSCAPCTYDVPPGFWYSSASNTNCSMYQDVIRQECPPGSYCLGGSTQPVACPAGLTSASGASRPDLCFCPVGFMKQQSASSPTPTCERVTCPNSTELGPPGPANTSTYYLRQDPITRITNCTLCGASSRAVGSMIGVESCVCAQGKYPTLAPDGLSVFSCTSCPTTCTNAPSTTSFLAACPMCATTSTPPFGTATPNSRYTCTDPYEAGAGASSATVLNIPSHTSGSSLYVPSAAAWTKIVAPLPFSACNPSISEPTQDLRIRHVAVSSTVSSLNSNIEPSAVVFWTNNKLDRGATAVVWATSASKSEGPVTCHTSSTTSYTTPEWSWDVIPGTSENMRTFDIDAIAVSPWIASEGNGVMLSSVVAALVRTTQIYTKTVSFALHAIFPSTSSQAAAGTFPLTTNALQMRKEHALNIAGASVVGMSHLQSFPMFSGVSPPHGAFLIAYNSIDNLNSPCGAVLVGVSAGNILNTITSLQLCSGPSMPTHRDGLLSFAVSGANPATPALFLLFADAPTTVYSARIISGSTQAPVAVANIAPHTLIANSYKDAVLSAVSSVWLESSSKPPVLVALASGVICDPAASGGSLSSNCIVAGDSLTRTMVLVQGMPFGSSPSLVAGSVLSTKNMIAATNAGIYALSLSACESGQYRAGSICLPQSCVRKMPCGFNEKSDGTVCQCAPGYYRSSGVCAACTSGTNFCPGGDLKQPCGNELVTDTANANSTMQCLCQATGTYFSLKDSRCFQCTADSTSYCPDRWNNIKCPEPADASAMSATLGTTTAAWCACGEGRYAPGCLPCPAGQVCPRGSTRLFNSARLFNVVTPRGVLSSPEKEALIAAVKSVLQVYYSSSGKNLVYGSTASEYVYAYVYNVSHATKYLQPYRLMVMVQQTQAGNSKWVEVLTGSSSTSYSVPTSGAVTAIEIDSSYTIAEQVVQASQPRACGALQTPSSSAAQCVCAPGAYMLTPWPDLSCTPCKSLTFMDNPNTASACKPCPLGASTGGATGAKNCSVVATSTDASSSGMPSITVIIGASVGAVVLLIAGGWYVWHGPK